MEIYVFRADIWCADCAEEWMEANPRPDHVDPLRENTYDSSEWPKGPISAYQNEADYAVHCGACGCFTENNLTCDGVENVAQAIESGEGNEIVHAEWAHCYQQDWPRIRSAVNRRAAAIALECEVDDLERILGCSFDENLVKMAPGRSVMWALSTPELEA
jgi:hypothetical protein